MKLSTAFSITNCNFSNEDELTSAVQDMQEETLDDIYDNESLSDGEIFDEDDCDFDDDTCDDEDDYDDDNQFYSRNSVR